jgi:hypothetical protein
MKYKKGFNKLKGNVSLKLEGNNRLKKMQSSSKNQGWKINPFGMK